MPKFKRKDEYNMQQADQAKRGTYAERPAPTPEELEAALEAMAPKVLPKAPPREQLEIDPEKFAPPIAPPTQEDMRRLIGGNKVMPPQPETVLTVEPAVKSITVRYRATSTQVLDSFYALVMLIFASFVSAAMGMFLLDLLLTAMPDRMQALADWVLG